MERRLGIVSRVLEFGEIVSDIVATFKIQSEKVASMMAELTFL